MVIDRGYVMWCKRCGIVCMGVECGVCGRKTRTLTRSDRVRPVFREEVEVLRGFVGLDLGDIGDYVLWKNGRVYYYEGKRVFTLRGDREISVVINDRDLLDVLVRLRGGRGYSLVNSKGTRQIDLFSGMDSQGGKIGRVIEAGRGRLEMLEREAIEFLRSVREEYEKRGVKNLAVSWSGGKDSTVASLLVRKAFPGERLWTIFADTTLEFSLTYEYINEFLWEYSEFNFVVEGPDRDFYELCMQVGPPSRTHRWCCYTHKSYPYSKAIRNLFGDGNVLSVVGIRRDESARRSGYKRIIDDTKIGKQVIIRPILDWTDFDVWLYLIANNAPINKAYKLGFNRVGCTICPFSNKLSYILFKHLFPEEAGRWEEFLVNIFSGKMKDAEKYVYTGAWKGRKGGKFIGNLDQTDIEINFCEQRPEANYNIPVEFDLNLLEELLKPIGRIKKRESIPEMGVYDIESKYGLLQVKAMPLWKRVWVGFPNKLARKRLGATIRIQLRKLSYCLDCGACKMICPYGAIERTGKTYHVIGDKCQHCLKCARTIKGGCIVSSVLK